MNSSIINVLLIVNIIYMEKSNTFWIVAVVIVFILGGWYFMSMKSTQTNLYPSKNVDSNSSIEQNNVEQKSATRTINVSSDPNLGNYLVASNGMTLYMFTKDAPSVSNCYDACAVNWPVYSVPINEPLTLGDGITGQLATITRTDGSSQLTYNGTPLYFWKNDLKIGDVTGQNVGGVWFVVKP